ncbi:MAG: IS110 family transposase [Sedimentisphaerales bacterium]|nr:IS110 family transposase [Sedimentisphaerales bacterium]
MRQLDVICSEIEQIEKRIETSFGTNEHIQLLMTLPGVGFILAVVIWLEIGDVSRFPSPQRLASYCGTVPRIHASGDKVRFGKLRPDTNHYLKWAFSEAANSIAVNRRHWPHRHVCQLYDRIRHKKGHAKAVGAVSRHLAEASYCMLNKKESYQERGVKNVSLTAV